MSIFVIVEDTFHSEWNELQSYRFLVDFSNDIIQKNTDYFGHVFDKSIENKSKKNHLQHPTHYKLEKYIRKK